jgi:hypothetical protein
MALIFAFPSPTVDAPGGKFRLSMAGPASILAQNEVHFRGKPMANERSERRSGQRKPVQVPVKVRKSDGTELSGETRDLSSNGIFLYSETGLEAGSKLELVVMLPASLGVGPGGWTLCEASVVRVEQGDGKSVGIAATLDRIELLPEIG